MPRVSTETQILATPEKFALNKMNNLLTPIKGEPPIYMGRGRRRNPIITKIYNQLVMSRTQWFHVNIPITSKKEVATLRASLYARARKDNFTISTSSVFNEQTQMFDMWIMLS